MSEDPVVRRWRLKEERRKKREEERKRRSSSLERTLDTTAEAPEAALAHRQEPLNKSKQPSPAKLLYSPQDRKITGVVEQRLSGPSPGSSVTYSQSPCKRAVSWNRKESSSSEEEDIVAIAKRLEAQAKKAKDVAPPAKMPKPNNPKRPGGWSDSDEEDLVQLSLQIEARRKKAEERHNPIALEKRSEQVISSPNSEPSIKCNNRDNDDLWDDSDGERERPPRKSTPSKRKNKKDVPGKSSSDSNNGKKRKKRSSRDSTSSPPSMPKYKEESYDADDDSDNEDDKEKENALIPEFSNPKLGPPSALVPLVLTKNDDDTLENDSSLSTVDEVPAAINRYLKDYQREGITFMYSGISVGRGVILGHDMGLGKTVQVISLLAALMKKTGTGKDLLDVKRRRRLISTRLKEKRAAADRALLQGHTIDADDEEMEDVGSHPKRTPVIIVVPSSVIQNWRNEFEAWGHFGVTAYQGQNRTGALERVRTGEDEVLVIGKTLFAQPDDFKAINSVPWKLAIVDEFHEYKNDLTQGFKSLQALKSTHHCPIIGLTGTAMQNEHKELFNLVNLVQPGFLGDWGSFKQNVSKPIMLGRTKDAGEEIIEKSHRRARELDEILKNVLLEKKKEEVKELEDTLPMKDEKVVFCELSPIQKRIYEHILSLPDYQLVRNANAPCDCGVNQRFFIEYQQMRTNKEKMDYQRRHHNEVMRRKKCCYQIPLNPRKDEDDQPLIDPMAVLWRWQHPTEEPCDFCPYCVLLPAMTILYKVCSHAALIQREGDPAKLPLRSKARLTAEKYLEFAKVALPPDVLEHLPGGSYIRADGIMDDHKLLSGKMETLDKMLRACSKRDDRVLVFSYSTTVLDLIQHYVRSEGYQFLRLDGSTPTQSRHELIERFQNDKSNFLFLISTKAGGLGLNLTGANVVIVFDVNWNPSYDEQAQDRAFRIGQTRDVQVVRLVARGTIEELKYIRQVYKVQLKQETLGTTVKKAPQAARLFRGVAGDKYRKGELFGSENLLKYKDGSFMSDIWKSADNRSPNNLGGVDVHRTEDLTNAISGMSVDDVEKIGESVFDENFDKVARGDPFHKKQSPKQQSSQMQGADLDGNDDQMMAAEENAVNHEDFLRGDRGNAALQLGDEGFDEEMGGFSQVVHNVLEYADVDISENEFTDDESTIEALSSPVVDETTKLDPICEEKSTENQMSPDGHEKPHQAAPLPDEFPLADLAGAPAVDLNSEKKSVESHSSDDEQTRMKLQVDDSNSEGKPGEKNSLSDKRPCGGLCSAEDSNDGEKPEENHRAPDEQARAQLDREEERIARRPADSDIKLMGVSRKKMKHKKGKFTVRDILG